MHLFMVMRQFFLLELHTNILGTIFLRKYAEGSFILALDASSNNANITGCSPAPLRRRSIHYEARGEKIYSRVFDRQSAVGCFQTIKSQTPEVRTERNSQLRISAASSTIGLLHEKGNAY